MYNIYYNDACIILLNCPPHEEKNYDLVFPFRGKKKHIFPVVDLLEKNSKPLKIVLWHDDVKQLWEAFQSVFVKVAAAGGIVRNASGKWLFIQRLGYLDLPKGKCDPGETHAQTAVREVMEETGLKEITIGSEAADTYHIYKSGKTRFLKHTVWFYMYTDTVDGLIPQSEEGITALFWMTPQEYINSHCAKYRSLTEMIIPLTEGF